MTFNLILLIVMWTFYIVPKFKLHKELYANEFCFYPCCIQPISSPIVNLYFFFQFYVVSFHILFRKNMLAYLYYFFSDNSKLWIFAHLDVITLYHRDPNIVWRALEENLFTPTWIQWFGSCQLTANRLRGEKTRFKYTQEYSASS